MTDTPNPSSRALFQPALPLLLICLGALLAFRLLALNLARIDIMLDEAQYWDWGYHLAFGYYSKPPLVAWAIRAMTEVCGNGVPCIRAVAPVWHTLTSIIIFFIGRTLYDRHIGFWSAIAFATLPGVSFLSFIINTDVLLLTFWSLALFAWIRLLERRSLAWVLVLGFSFGLGLLAKYAMIYFVLCVVVHAVFSREAREVAWSWRGALAFVIGVALLIPNFIWNAETGFVTFFHTAVNAGWKYPFVHLGALINYVVGQIGVFGPIFFFVFFWAAWRAKRETDPRTTLLLSFSLPVLALIAVQALLSRAHANWSATAYPAATVLVTVLLYEQRWRLFVISLWLHVAAALVIGVAPAFAPEIPFFEENQALSRSLGWAQLASVVQSKLNEGHYGSLLVPTRELAAELLYYLRNSRPPLYVWRTGEWPAYHYEMTQPFTAASPEPVLFVSLKGCDDVRKAFRSITDLGMVEVPIGPREKRSVYFCRLEGFLLGDVEKNWREPPMRSSSP